MSICVLFIPHCPSDGEYFKYYIEYIVGTYFNCIMFMVASSVVSTILILNYHHRNADSHEMSDWVRSFTLSFTTIHICMIDHLILDSCYIFILVAMHSTNVETRPRGIRVSFIVICDARKETGYSKS